MNLFSTKQACIQGQALAHNLSVVRRLAPKSRVLAFVKANAYGHGLLLAAEALASADGFAVATLSAALTLRAAYPDQTIVLTSTAYQSGLIQVLSDHRLDWVVFDAKQLEGLTQERGRSLRIWLKIDTGMHRFGFAPEDVPNAVATLQRCPWVHDMVLMSHMACAESRDHPLNHQQLGLFESVCQPYGYDKSIAKSATLVHFPEASYQWVRPGAMLYGIDPVTESHPDLGLRPAMTLRGRVVSIQHVGPGEVAGYGGTWQAQRETRLALVGLGYADGYPRQVANGTPAWINGAVARIAGRVSMDVLSLDVTDVACQVGDWVELWGGHVSVDTVAKAAGTTAYACLTGLGDRVERVEKGS